MKTVVYVRVSTNKQDNDRQLMDITKYCLANDLNVVSTFEEKESGM
jgi:DNA invertase Pin-like site-specific DNA recombinase